MPHSSLGPVIRAFFLILAHRGKGIAPRFDAPCQRLENCFRHPIALIVTLEGISMLKGAVRVWNREAGEMILRQLTLKQT